MAKARGPYNVDPLGYKTPKQPKPQVKVEGPMHVVCQCDKCKAQPQRTWVGLMRGVRVDGDTAVRFITTTFSAEGYRKMTPNEKAIRDFCGHHADWWPSTTQIQEMLALAQPCPTCEALARTVMLDQTSHDQFKPDYNTEAVLVEEMQRMAKRIEDLEMADNAKELGLNHEPEGISMNEIDQLKSVLCGPNGKCCISGSDEDRAIVDRALQTLAKRTWVGLTEDERDAILRSDGSIFDMTEAKLKEKNHDR